MSANDQYYATPESIMTDRQMYEASEAAFKRVCTEADTALAELAELASSSGSDHIAAKYWKQRQDARNELCTVKDERDAAKWERDAALAVIEQVRALRDEMFAELDSPLHVIPLEMVIERLDPVLSQSPASAPTKVACGDHGAVQHRDGKPPWCPHCGLTADGLLPLSKLPPTPERSRP